MGSQASFLASVKSSGKSSVGVKIQDKSLQISLKYYDDKGQSQPAGYLNLVDGSDKEDILKQITKNGGFLMAPPLSESFSWEDFLASQRPFDCYLAGLEDSIGSIWPIKDNIKGFKPLTRQELYELKKADNLFTAGGGGSRKLSEEAKAYLV